MSVRTVHQSPGITDLINQGQHAGLKVDTDFDAMAWKDDNGIVKSPGRPKQVTIAGDGAITIEDSVVVLTKGSAAAITLAAPTLLQANTRITITAGSAFAHVVTATALVQDGVTGGAKTTLTFGAFLGATIELIAIGLFWHVVSKNVVVIT